MRFEPMPTIERPKSLIVKKTPQRATLAITPIKIDPVVTDTKDPVPNLIDPAAPVSGGDVEVSEASGTPVGVAALTAISEGSAEPHAATGSSRLVRPSSFRMGVMTVIEMLLSIGEEGEVE